MKAKGREKCIPRRKNHIGKAKEYEGMSTPRKRWGLSVAALERSCEGGPCYLEFFFHSVDNLL